AGALATITVGPAGTSLAVRNLVTTAADAVEKPITIRRVPGTTALEVRGSVSINAGRIVRNVSVDNPTIYFVSALRQGLTAAGIAVRGQAVDIDDLADPPSRQTGTTIISHRSPPLSELAQTMMRLSQNLYAETLLKTLGSVDGPGTAESGRLAIAGIVREWGIGPTDLVVEDGSGLTRYNLATPEALAGILAHVDRDQRLRGPFEASLPI